MGGKYNATIPEFAFQSINKIVFLYPVTLYNVSLQMYSDKGFAQGVHF